MDAKTFLAEFAHVANAPNGVPLLRHLVVNLAVTGRLIQPSLENDSVTAKEVLRLASVEKGKLIAAGEARRSRPETSLPTNERLT